MNERCFDCGMMQGEFHGHGCDQEDCPCCGEQLITCPHGRMVVGHEVVYKSRRHLRLRVGEMPAMKFWLISTHRKIEHRQNYKPADGSWALEWQGVVEFGSGNVVRGPFKSGEEAQKHLDRFLSASRRRRGFNAHIGEFRRRSEAMQHAETFTFSHRLNDMSLEEFNVWAVQFQHERII